MAISQVELCNLALSRSGGHRITQITSLGESSNEARQCAVKLPHLIRTALRAYPWRFATKKIVLARTKIDPTSSNHSQEVKSNEALQREIRALYGQKYLYQYPEDCLLAQCVYSISHSNKLMDFTVELAKDGTKLIITDAGDAVLIYTASLTDVSQWDPLFYDAIAWQLAVELCIGLGNDLQKAKQLEEKAKFVIENAKNIDAKESSHEFFRYSYLQARN